jgi:hypothetical protein
MNAPSSGRGQLTHETCTRRMIRPRWVLFMGLVLVTGSLYIRWGAHRPMIPQHSAKVRTVMPDGRASRSAHFAEDTGKLNREEAFKHRISPALGASRREADFFTLDDSTRCRHSEICDRHPSEPCSPGPDNLGCVTEPRERKEALRQAIKWAWHAYERCAWGQDELKPISCSHGTWMGLGLTLVDSLDTLILAGLKDVRPHSCLFCFLICCLRHSRCGTDKQPPTKGRRLPGRHKAASVQLCRFRHFCSFHSIGQSLPIVQEAERAISWIESSLDPGHPAKSDDNVSHFETTIRILAGLLSAFHLLNGDSRILPVAIDTGMRLLAAFSSPDGIPRNNVDMRNLTSFDAAWTTEVSLSEATTLSLEFGYLARVSCSVLISSLTSRPCFGVVVSRCLRVRAFAVQSPRGAFKCTALRSVWGSWCWRCLMSKRRGFGGASIQHCLKRLGMMPACGSLYLSTPVSCACWPTRAGLDIRGEIG